MLILVHPLENLVSLTLSFAGRFGHCSTPTELTGSQFGKQWMNEAIASLLLVGLVGSRARELSTGPGLALRSHPSVLQQEATGVRVKALVAALD